MALAENLVLVFVAGLITALSTGLGSLPFFVVDDFSDRWNVGLWGLASGIMVAASVFGLVREGLAYGSSILLVSGMILGVALVVVGHPSSRKSTTAPGSTRRRTPGSSCSSSAS